MRKAFSELLKRARLAGTQIILEVRGKRLSVVVEERGGTEQTLFDFADSIPFEESAGSIPQGVISFQLHYLLPLVETVVSEQIEIGLKPSPDGGLDPLVLVDGELSAALMPMRL